MKVYTMTQDIRKATYREVLWWCLFFVCALWVQYFVSGVDATIVGLLIALQGRKLVSIILVSIIGMFLQEATGTLAFGSVLLWYSLFISFFFVGKLFFTVTSISFVLLLSFVAMLCRAMLIYIFASIENFTVVLTPLVFDSIFQCIIVPVLWYPTYITYKRFVGHGNSV